MSVHLLGMSISRLMHCAEAVLVTYDAYYRTTYVATYVGYLLPVSYLYLYVGSAEPMNLLPTEHPGPECHTPTHTHTSPRPYRRRAFRQGTLQHNNMVGHGSARRSRDVRDRARRRFVSLFDFGHAVCCMRALAPEHAHAHRARACACAAAYGPPCTLTAYGLYVYCMLYVHTPIYHIERRATVWCMCMCVHTCVMHVLHPNDCPPLPVKCLLWSWTRSYSSRPQYCFVCSSCPHMSGTYVFRGTYVFCHRSPLPELTPSPSSRAPWRGKSGCGARLPRPPPMSSAAPSLGDGSTQRS
eukprot:scaffold12034_cov155-Isochrysis_galbana.AAC.7